MPVPDAACLLRIAVTIPLIPPILKTNKKKLSEAGATVLRPGPGCVYQGSSMGSLARGHHPELPPTGPGLPACGCRLMPPIRQPSPRPSLTGYILPRPHLAQTAAPAVPTPYPHSASVKPGAPLPPPQTWYPAQLCPRQEPRGGLGEKSEAPSHFTSAQLGLCAGHDDCMLVSVRWASRRFHSFHLPHRLWENRSCSRRAYETIF